MKVKRRPRRQGPLVHALYLNAGLLAVILAVLLMRGNGPGLASPAFAAPQMAPIAGGGGVFLMPAQFSINTWGCYLMDIDSQNICAYQYFPSDRQLRFVAGRNYREDRKVKDWNTSPHPGEVARMVELEKAPLRGAPESGAGPAPDPATVPGPDSTSPPSAPSGSSTVPTTTTNPWTLDQPVKPGDSTKPGDEKVVPPATKGQ